MIFFNSQIQGYTFKDSLSWERRHFCHDLVYTQSSMYLWPALLQVFHKSWLLTWCLRRHNIAEGRHAWGSLLKKREISAKYQMDFSLKGIIHRFVFLSLQWRAVQNRDSLIRYQFTSGVRFFFFFLSFDAKVSMSWDWYSDNLILHASYHLIQSPNNSW